MTDKTIYILGAGGHGAVVCEAIRASGASPAAFLDKDKEKQNSKTMDLPVLDKTEALESLNPTECAIANGIGEGTTRRKAFLQLREQGFEVHTVIHPSAIFPADLQIGDGAQLMAGCVIQPRVTIGENVVLNTRCSIDHDCAIGAHSFLAPGAVLCGDVRIGDASHVGANATVIEKITIGRNVVIGAGAVVIRSIPDSVTAVGVPAQILK